MLLRVMKIYFATTGLLGDSTRVVASRPAAPEPLRDVIINDYFATSAEEVGSLSELSGDSLLDALRRSSASQCVLAAKQAYSQVSLRGSDAKDNLGAVDFTVAGAQFLSDLSAGADCRTFVGKRLSLAYISLQVAALPAVTEELASMLAGSWVSFLQFRKCLSCSFDTFFRLGRWTCVPSGFQGLT